MTALVNQTVPAKLPVLHITQSAAKT
jgi:hypothetical protein